MRKIILKTGLLLFSLSLPCFAKELDPPAYKIAELVQDQTEFATSFYQTLNLSVQSNPVFSPYSLTSCLSMLFLGARGATAEEIQSALQLNVDRDVLANTWLTLNQQLDSSPSGYALKTANALWVDPQTYVFSDYSHALESAFRAQVSQVDFKKPSEALETINRWASDHTEGKIGSLLGPQEIDPQTRLVLTSAFYFQGTFLSPFDEKKTRLSPFHPTPDTTSSIPMMQQTASLLYMENDLIQMAGFPFNGGQKGKMALIVLLPRSTDNLTEIENDLSDSFSEWLKAMKEEKLDVQIPKFATKSSYDLKPTLQKMGMTTAFTSQANFSGIDGKLDLFLNKVVHETLFTIDEKGVVAGSTTAATINATSTSTSKAPIPFYADRPFFYFIVEMKTQEILVMGKFQELQAPRSSS
jgi:serpin B